MTSPDQDQRPGKPRGGNGQFVPTVEAAEKAAEAARLRSRGMTYTAIAKALGYTDAANARRAIQKALVAIVAEPAAEVRKLELAHLNSLRAAAIEVLERDHVTVSHGRIIRDDRTDEPILDDGPKLAAIDRLIRIMERHSKLLGLDAPSKHVVMTDDALDAEIDELAEELERAEAAEAEGAEEAPGA